MSTSERLQLQVEVDRAASPVSGRVATSGRPDRLFVGWTELFSVLQAAVADADPRRPCTQPP